MYIYIYIYIYIYVERERERERERMRENERERERERERGKERDMLYARGPELREQRLVAKHLGALLSGARGAAPGAVGVRDFPLEGISP